MKNKLFAIVFFNMQHGGIFMRILLFPFFAIWTFIGILFKLLGKLMSAIVGTVILIVGLILTFTLIGAIVGIPLSILGFLLIIRAFF